MQVTKLRSKRNFWYIYFNDRTFITTLKTFLKFFLKIFLSQNRDELWDSVVVSALTLYMYLIFLLSVFF